MNKHRLQVSLRLLMVISLIILGTMLLYFIGKLTIPFIIGFVIALIINPLVDYLQIKTRMKRTTAVFTSILIIALSILAIISLLVNEIISGFSYLSKVIPENYNNFSTYIENVYVNRITPIYDNLLSVFQSLGDGQQSTLLDTLQLMGSKLAYAFSSLFQSIGNGLYSVIKKLPNLATIFIISLLAAFFISKDWNYIVKKMQKNIPESIQIRINQIYIGLQKAILGFLKAELKLTFITAVTVFIGLIILRVKHALTITLVIWIVDFLPYIGSILVIAPWALYNFFTGNIFLGTGLTILYGVIVVQRQLIKPKILSSSIGISPLMTLLTMYVGFKLIGFFGIIFGPLTFIMIKILYEIGLFHDMMRYVLGKEKNHVSH